jgi:pimeloyl-ACP methyl ester carboxylesterase
VSRIVLIHGAWHGGWCWDKVVPLLEAQGHAVAAPDLPGHGQDRTPAAQITLESYVERVCGELDAHPEPAVLVGHSMGGAVNALAAERRPGQVRRLVFLTALLPRDGQTMVDLTSTPANAGSAMLPNFVVSADRLSCTVRDDAMVDCFYGDCPAEDVARAKGLVVPTAVAPMATPIRLTAENFGRVPRVYIECRRDRALLPAAQRAMHEATPCERVHALEGSHSPFFSMPDALAGLIGEETARP